MTAEAPRALIICAAVSAAMAIGAGAFGAHAAPSAEAAGWLRTGGQYQLVSAVAVLILSRHHPRSAMIMLIGALIFAVTLYAMAAGAPRWLGAITPIGGAMMIAAWLCVALSAARGGHR